MRRAWIAIAILAAAFVASLSPLGADYGNLGCHVNAPRCDEPAWPLEALARGDFSTFVHDQPLMGPASLLLRAPFAAASRLFHADLTWHYRAGVFACLLVAALLALALAQRARRTSRLNAAAVAVLAFVNPLTISAIRAGHPEELVAAAAVAGAALLSLDRRWLLAAVLLGLAIATKAWAILAVAPLLVVIAAPDRKRFAIVAAAVMLALYAPLAVGDPDRLGSVIQSAGSLGSRYGEATAPDAWFFSARAGDFTWPTEIRDGEMEFADASGYRVSNTDAHLAHALVVAIALALTLAWWRAGGPASRETLFLLLAAILLARCFLDAGDHIYYHVAVALSLLGYDAIRPRARFPWLSAGFIAGLWGVTRLSDHLATDRQVAWLYMGFAASMFALVMGLALIECRRSRSTPPITQLPISPRHVTGSSRA
jgi:hypothetical protein